jgi:hypothetical protein
MEKINNIILKKEKLCIPNGKQKGDYIKIESIKDIIIEYLEDSIKCPKCNKKGLVKADEYYSFGCLGCDISWNIN